MSLEAIFKLIIDGGAIVIMAALLAGVLYVVLFRMPRREDSRDAIAAAERAMFLKAIQDMGSRAETALDHNTAVVSQLSSAVEKLECAVEKLERRLDEHDRLLERVRGD